VVFREKFTLKKKNFIKKKRTKKGSMGTCVALDCRKNAFLAEFWTFKGSEKLRKNLVFQIFSMSLALISIAFLTPKMDSDRLDMTTKYILFNFLQLCRNKLWPSPPPSPR